jgi:hypothetical protein
MCWTEERKREKKNSLKSRFSFSTRIPDSLCEKKEEEEQKEGRNVRVMIVNLLAEKEGRVMDIWTYVLVVV